MLRKKVLNVAAFREMLIPTLGNWWEKNKYGERIPGNDVSLKHLKHDSICIQQTTVNILYRGTGLTLPTKKKNRESRKNRDLTASNWPFWFVYTSN